VRYFPFFHDLHQRACLIVGGGEVALRKARLLARAGARLVVVAPECEPELLRLIAATGGHYREAPFSPSLLDGVALVIAATDDDTVNAAVSEAAQARQLPVNVVDNPALCSIITPAIIDRSPLLIAVTSGGEAPVLARWLRAKVEASLPQRIGDLAQFASRFRDAVKARFGSGDQRRRFWESVFDGPIAERVLAGQSTAAEAVLRQAINDGQVPSGGEVYLVGAGPGDPDLLTFKALRLMQQAEVVLYDRLVSEPILDLVRRDAERIYVGKRRSEHAVPQEGINALLVRLAKSGKRVLRLKGGDPFIFGRGGEEIESLAQEGIPFQVVPGITAATGCAAYAGIPLTHRDHAQSVRFITGHLKDGGADVAYSELVSPNQTLVFYMGLVALPELCQKLIAHGKDPATPAALIERGTTPAHRLHLGTLASLPDVVARAQVSAPTLLIIGSVVSLHSRLQWFTPGEDRHQARGKGDVV
jgi:uroporphyrin-III C-methyltransferase / precorrin-2 dehydrogenase / sirohydrochlorin ferrochelatase